MIPTTKYERRKISVSPSELLSNPLSMKSCITRPILRVPTAAAINARNAPIITFQ